MTDSIKLDPTKIAFRLPELAQIAGVTENFLREEIERGNLEVLPRFGLVRHHDAREWLDKRGSKKAGKGVAAVKTSARKKPILSAKQLEEEYGVKMFETEDSGKTVSVTIRVDESKRVWWNMQSKLQRTTITQAVIEALDKRFGLPEID